MTYYVDFTTGDDEDSGLTEALAWKTIAKVNAASLSAGDSVLFKRGETWREQLTIPSSGSDGSPITFGAYGTGDLPKILGSIAVTGWDQTAIPAVAGDLLAESFDPTVGASNHFATAGDGHLDDSKWTGTLGSGSVLDADNTDIADSLGGSTEILKVQKVSANFNSKGRNDLGETKAVTYFTGWVYVSAHGLASDGNGVRLFSAFDTGGSNLIWEVKFHNNGGNIGFKFIVYTNSGYVATWGGNGTWTGGWHRIDVLYDDTGHTYAWLIDSVSKTSGSITGTHYTGMRYIDVGDATNSYTITAYFDRVEVSSTEYYTDEIELPANCWKAIAGGNGVWFINSSDGKTHWGAKQTLITDCTSEYEYWWGTSHLVCYAVTTPDTRYESVEATARDYGVYSDEKNYITIQDIEVAYSYIGGIYVGNDISYVTIQRNVVHHIGGVRNSGEGRGIYLKRLSYGLIANNTVYETALSGIYQITNGTTRTAVNNVYEHNEVYNGYHSNIDLLCQSGCTSSGHIVRYNFSYYTSDYDISLSSGAACYYSEGQSGGPVDLTDWYYNIALNVVGYGIQIGGYSTNHNLYNNTVYGTLTGAVYPGGIAVSATGTSAIVIKNNIAMDASVGGSAGCLYVPTLARVTACDNNCWYMSAGGSAVYANVGGTSYHYDDFAAYKSATGWDTNGLWEDPLMTDPANGDFTPQSGSPCINAGADVGLTEDYAGNPIVGLPDIGAYEYQMDMAIFFGCDF